jgi:hypothetical protein
VSADDVPAIEDLPVEAERVIDAYLDALMRRIPAGRRARAAIRAELLDGLHCAARSRTENGVRPARAAAEAVREFGPPGVVAGAFVEELCAGWARRVGVALLCGGPAVGLLWVLATPAGPGSGLTERVTAAVAVSPLLPLVLALAVPAAVLAAAGSSRPALGIPAAGRVAAPAALFAVVLCALGDASLIAATVGPGQATSGALLLAVVASVCRLTAVVTAGWRLARLRAAVI